MERKHNEKYIQMGLNIAYYRKLRNLTQEELAERVDVSRTHISNIEATRVDKSLSLDLLFDIAEVLSIDVAKLFEIR